jgi:hypothetical protein
MSPPTDTVPDYMRYSGWLTYRRIKCLRCSEARIVGVPCPTCGASPDEREVDPDRQHRQRVAGRALMAFATAQLRGKPLHVDPSGIWDRISALLERFLAAVFAGLADPSLEDRLMEAISDLKRLQADLGVTPRLRPWIETWQAVEDVLSAG